MDKQIVFEDEHTAWISHANKGLYRVKFDENYETITEIKDYNKKGLWSDYFVRIYKLKNTIAFHTIKGWQNYESLMDSVVPYNLLNEKKEFYERITSISNIIVKISREWLDTKINLK